MHDFRYHMGNFHRRLETIISTGRLCCVYAPVYFSLYSNWLYALLTPVTLFFIVAFVQRNGFYTGSYITDLLLKGIVGLCFYGFIAESFNLYISWKDYCENNSGIYSLYNYKNFTEYYKKVTVYNWRAVVKKGRKDLLDGNP